MTTNLYYENEIFVFFLLNLLMYVLTFFKNKNYIDRISSRDSSPFFPDADNNYYYTVRRLTISILTLFCLVDPKMVVV